MNLLQAAQRIEELEKMMEWKPIDSFPVTGSHLAYSPTFGVNIYYASEVGEFPHLTHWMPLPNPPKDAGNV